MVPEVPRALTPGGRENVSRGSYGEFGAADAGRIGDGERGARQSTCSTMVVCHGGGRMCPASIVHESGVIGEGCDR
jgi:hypothetical protein